MTDPAQLFAQNLEAAFRVGQRLAQFLEKLGLVPSAAAWFDAGLLRNQLAHSYPLSNPKQIHRINGAFGRTGLLLATFNSVRTHAHDKGLARIPVGPLPETDLQP